MSNTLISNICKDTHGRLWFKSDTQLVDITEALEFRVRERGWFFKSHVLEACFREQYVDIFEAKKCRKVWKEIGRYNGLSLASFDLGQILEYKSSCSK
jgi:hypothetical protein